MTTTTATRTRKCRRCSGTGSVDTAVLHRGIAGLCMSCDGAGVKRVRSAEEIAAAKVAGEQHRQEMAAAAALSAAIFTLDRAERVAAQTGLAHLKVHEPARHAQALNSVRAGRTAAVVAHLVAYGKGL